MKVHGVTPTRPVMLDNDRESGSDDEDDKDRKNLNDMDLIDEIETVFHDAQE